MTDQWIGGDAHCPHTAQNELEGGRKDCATCGAVNVGERRAMALIDRTAINFFARTLRSWTEWDVRMKPEVAHSAIHAAAGELEAIAALPAVAAPGVRVKPLEWRDFGEISSAFDEVCQCGVLAEGPEEKSRKEAKRAARILAALDTSTPAPVSDAGAANPGYTTPQSGEVPASSAPTPAPDAVKALPDLEPTQVGDIFNPYGGLMIMAKDGKPFWCIGMWGEYDWKPCPPDVFAAIRAGGGR